MYDIVKRYYDKGIYSVEDVRKFVVAKKIKEEEFTQITGEAY